MQNHEIAPRLAVLVLVARQLAQDMESMAEAPAGAISKYSTYLIGLKSSPTPKVGRCAVLGWGDTQRKQVNQLARDAASDIPDALATAVISQHPSAALPKVEVSVFVQHQTFLAEFACTVAESGSITYSESEDQAKKSINEMTVTWVSTLPPPKRKKFLGLF